MKKINGWWVDENCNRWSEVYSESQAETYSKTMIDCSGCSDCHDCYDCSGCYDCTHCSDCYDCTHCSDCYDCYDCSGCHDCTHCSDCYGCSGCFYCSDCHDCYDCSGCFYCHDCYDCSGCRCFARNPQRIVSGLIGSRNAQTTVYYDGQKTQVVCGCFRGDLDGFERKVEEVHKNNPKYLGEYRDFIKRVRDFWGLKKEDEQ